MKLYELEAAMQKAGAKPDEGTFLLARSQGFVECKWLDCYLGAFLCAKAGPGVFYVRDFMEVEVCPLTGAVPAT